MSQLSDCLFLAGVRCDVPGCETAIWRTGPSKETAAIAVLEAARDAKWKISADRLHEVSEASRQDAPLTIDKCPGHVEAARDAAKGMTW